jgi:hypothetical protein
MELTTPPSALHQDCLDKLSRALDLVLKTAEAAGAANDHKMVIQSAREATRIVALIHKMTNTRTKPAPSPRGGLTIAKTAAPYAPAKQPFSRPERTGMDQPAPGRTDHNPDDLVMPDLEALLSPGNKAFLDYLPDRTFEKFSKDYREIQALEKEVAAFLRDTNQKSAAAD